MNATRLIKNNSQIIPLNQRGMSVLSVVVMLGVLLTVSGGIISRMVQISRLEIYHRQRVEFDEVSSRMAMRLSLLPACRDSLGKQILRNDDQLIMYDIGTTGSKVFAAKNRYIEDMRISDLSVSGLNYIGMEGNQGIALPAYTGNIHFSVENPTGFGAAQFETIFPVSFYASDPPTTPGEIPPGLKIVACYATEPYSIIARKMCESKGGIYVIGEDPVCQLPSTITSATPVSIDFTSEIAEYFCTQNGGRFDIIKQKCTFATTGVNAQVDAVINVNPDNTYSYTKKEVEGLVTPMIERLIKGTKP